MQIKIMHTPVLLEETIELLRPDKGKFFIDGTVNGGGHSDKMLKLMGKKGVLIGIDRDHVLLEKSRERFQKDKRFRAVLGNFRNMKELVSPYFKKADGILLDLGMSSVQLEESGRGFSFKNDEPLDMRFGHAFGEEGDSVTAREIINSVSEKELAEIFRKYGEERFSYRIARNIVKARAEKPINTVSDLVKIIQRCVPYRGYRKIHPATRIFQALRIAVNDELGALEAGLDSAWEILNDSGRLVVISYHSLEDRIVKNFFRKFKVDSPGSVILTKKPVRAGDEEIKLNFRARSAKLRAIQK